MEKLIKSWHLTLDMPKHDLVWHIEDIAREFEEWKKAKGLIDKWSELSDVAYTYTRAQWSGHIDTRFPFKKIYLYIGFIYMLPKYSLRYGFYRVLGKKINKNVKLKEVRNPRKIEKLEHIANKYNLDPTRFKTEAEKLMRRWVFLK